MQKKNRTTATIKTKQRQKTKKTSNKKQKKEVAGNYKKINIWLLWYMSKFIGTNKGNLVNSRKQNWQNSVFPAK